MSLPSRPGLRRAALAVTAGLLLPLSGPASASTPSPAPRPSADPAPVDADPCSGASTESPVRVEVTQLLPRAPQTAEEPFQVAGRLRNCGDDPVTDLEVRLATGDRIASRGALARADAEPAVGTRRLAVPLTTASLAPGATTPFDLRLAVGDLRLGRLGVYPLSVQARGRSGQDRSRTPLGLATTFVPWFPDGPPAPTRVAWLWPLVDSPRRAPDEALLDDGLDALLSPGSGSTPRGRLAALLAAARDGSRGACDPAAGPLPDVPVPPPAAPCRGEPVPVTYGVDPALVDAVEATTRPYRVLSDGDVSDRPASAAATGWLAALRAAVASDGSALLALPFGDPDVVAMSRTGSGLRDEVDSLRSLGRSEAQRLLDVEPLADVAWPPPGPLGPALDRVAGDATAVVLDASAVPPPSVFRSRTPSAPTAMSSVNGLVTGLVVEEVLSELVAAGSEQGPRLAEQRWIAETAILAAELPSQSRTLVLAPPRRAAVVPAVATQVLADTGRLPWLCPVPLADVAAGRERCAGLPDAQPPAEPEEREGEVDPERSDRLSEGFLDRLDRVSAAADQLTETVLLPGTEQAAATKARLLRATGRAASSAWRSAPLEGDRVLRLLQDEVVGLRSRVRLVSKPVTLTGSSGRMELVVQNELDQPVEVAVRLDETSAARLDLPETGPQVVPARRAQQILVEVEPRTSGRFVVLATLVDREGRPFGEPVQLSVTSTQYGTGGARRHRRRGRRPARRGRGAHHPPRAAPGARVSLSRSTRAMAVGTVASRGTGFLRTAVLASVLGVESVAAAYNVANTAPNIVYELLLGGVLTSVVVPLLVRAAKEDGDEGAAYAQRLLTLVALVLGTTAVVLVAAAPLLVDLYAGELDPESRELAVVFARYFLPQVLFYGVGAVLGAVLNTRGRYSPPMWAPVLNNLVVIATGLVFLVVRGTGELTPGGLTSGQVALLGVGTTLGIVAQTVALVPSLRAAGFSLRPRWDFRALDLRRIGRLAQWVLLYVVANQLAYLVVVRASADEVLVEAGRGYPSYVYAFVLWQLPHAVVAVSVITALLPRMSRAAADGRTADLRASLERGLRLTASVLVPAAAAFVVLGRDLAVLVFGRGQVSVDDARFIGVLLAVFAVGLVPFSAYQLQLRAFYAMQDTRTPTLVNLVVNATLVVVGMVLYVLLPDRYEVLGLAAGHASSFVVGLVVCSVVLSRRLRSLDGSGLQAGVVVRTVVRCLVAVLVPALLAAGVTAVVGETLGQGPLGALVSLVVGGAVLGVGYVLVARRMRVTEVTEVAGPVLRRVGLR